MLENLLKTIVDESVMTDNAKIAFASLLAHMTRLQLKENIVQKMITASQQFSWLKFPATEGRWLMHEASLFPRASN